MSRQKETPINTAMLTGAKLKAEQATTSTMNDTTTPPPGQAVHIANFLLPGQENAVPLKYLKELLHLDGRTVRLMIRAERLRGIPILADNVTGYYLPANEQEREHCVTSMKHRANEIIRAADAIEQARW